MLQFEWDPDQAATNHRKHRVTFAEAATAFGDPLSLTIPDPGHAIGEARFVLLGLTYEGRLVVVAQVERGDTIRIVSARSATRSERRTYEQEE